MPLPRERDQEVFKTARQQAYACFPTLLPRRRKREGCALPVSRRVWDGLGVELAPQRLGDGHGHLTQLRRIGGAVNDPHL